MLFFYLISRVLKKYFLFVSTFFLLCLFACSSPKKTTAGKPGKLDSDRTLTVEFHPFWGGMAAAELERKKGVDQLRYTYIIRKAMGDSSYSSFANISKEQADTLFARAEKVNWDPGINYGKCADPIGLMVFASLKKGPATKQYSMTRMHDVNDLPPALLVVAQLLNQLAPEDLKLY